LALATSSILDLELTITGLWLKVFTAVPGRERDLTARCSLRPTAVSPCSPVVLVGAPRDARSRRRRRAAPARE
jgi:hypothetical protein